MPPARQSADQKKDEDDQEKGAHRELLQRRGVNVNSAEKFRQGTWCMAAGPGRGGLCSAGGKRDAILPSMKSGRALVAQKGPPDLFCQLRWRTALPALRLFKEPAGRRVRNRPVLGNGSGQAEPFAPPVQADGVFPGNSSDDCGVKATAARKSVLTRCRRLSFLAKQVKKL